jgi:hypothetical protein
MCCKDYRFVQGIQAFVRERLRVPWYDLKATAGGVRPMLDAPARVRAWIMDDIALVHRVHGVRRVVLAQHQDCAVYGGSRAFAGDADEAAFQRAQLLRARTALLAAMPDLTIRLFFARLVDGRVVCEEFHAPRSPAGR